MWLALYVHLAPPVSGPERRQQRPARLSWRLALAWVVGFVVVVCSREH